MLTTQEPNYLSELIQSTPSCTFDPAALIAYSKIGSNMHLLKKAFCYAAPVT